MAFLALRFPPGSLERLGCDLDTNRVAGQNIPIPTRMRVGTAFGCDDDDFTTDIALDQRPDIVSRRLATHTLDQAVRGQRTPADGAGVHDVAAPSQFNGSVM